MGILGDVFTLGMDSLLSGDDGADIPKTTTQTSKSEPWAPAQPYLLQGFKYLYDALNHPYVGQYTGGANYLNALKTIPFTGPEQQGQAAQLEYARQLGQMIPGLMSGFTNTLSSLSGSPKFRTLQQETGLSRGQLLNPETNPYLQRAVSSAIRPMRRQTEGLLNQIGSAAQQGGAYGGARQGLLEAGAINDLQRNIGDISSGMYGGAYQNALNALQNQGMQRNQFRLQRSGLQQGAQALQQRGYAMLPQLFGLGLLPGNIMSDVGGQQRGLEQQRADQYATGLGKVIDRPFQVAQMLLGGAGGTGGGASTTTGPNPAYYQYQMNKPSPLQQALGLGTLAAGLFTGNPMLMAGGGSGMLGNLGGLGGLGGSGPMAWGIPSIPSF